MPSHLYEYAVIRYLPRVEREEFLNVGLIMMCRRRRWLECRVHLDSRRLEPFNPVHSVDEIMAQLEALVRVAKGDAKAGVAAGLDVDERFRWLTAVRSSCIATSRPHPGHSDDLDSTFARLFSELVL